MKDKQRKVHVKEDKNNLIKRRVYAVLKWVLYVLIVCVSYAFMMTPGFFQLGSIRPLLVLPMVICVSVFEGELAGGGFAIFSGVLWASGVSVFWGFTPIVLYVIAVFCGAIATLYLQENLPSTMILAGISIAFYLLCYFFVEYAIWNYGNASEIFMNTFVPTFFFTWAITPIYYFIVKGIHTLVSQRSGNLWSE